MIEVSQLHTKIPSVRCFYNHLSNYTKTIIHLRLVNIGEYSLRLWQIIVKYCDWQFFCRHSGYLIWKSWMKQARDHCQVNNKQPRAVECSSTRDHMAKCKVSHKLSVKKLLFKHHLTVVFANRGGYENVVHSIFSWIHGFIDFNKCLG